VYYRRLLEAGVESTVRTVAGSFHASDLMFRNVTPDLYDATVESMHRFAADL